MGNSASNKEDEERERRKMLGPFSEKEYKNLQFAFSGIITSQTLEQVQERENQQDGKKRLKDRKKVSDKNVTVPIQDVVQFLQLAGIIDSDKSEIIVSKLLDFHPGVSAVSFDDLKEGLAILLKGTTSEVRFRLYSAGVATDFETIFSLIHVIGDVLRGNKLCEGTNGSTTKVGHIVSGLKYYAAENADSDHQYPQVGFQVFNRWCEIEVPSLSKDLQGWFHKRLLGAGKLKSSCSVAPSIIQESVLKPEVVYALSCSSSVFNGEKPWQRLFTTRTQGMSFELLSESIIGYGGPTLLVIRDTLGNIFGGYSTSTWKEDTKFYGDSNCVLYALWPRFNVFRARISNSQDSNNYQYLNTKSRTKDHGIGFGGRDGALRLWIGKWLLFCSPQDKYIYI